MKKGVKIPKQGVVKNSQEIEMWAVNLRRSCRDSLG